MRVLVKGFELADAARISADPSIILLSQLSKERGGFFEVARIEAFSEGTVDRRKEITSLGALVVVAPEAGETRGDAQLPKPGLLVSSHGQGVAERGFGFCKITG